MQGDFINGKLWNTDRTISIEVHFEDETGWFGITVKAENVGTRLHTTTHHVCSYIQGMSGKVEAERWLGL